MTSSFVTAIVILIFLVLVLFVQSQEKYYVIPAGINGNLNSQVTEHLTQMQSCVNNQLPPGSWIDTCKNHLFGEDGLTLNAQCLTNQGNYAKTSIYLDTCLPQNCNVYNNNGQLQCGYINHPAPAMPPSPPATPPVTPPPSAPCVQQCIIPQGTWLQTCRNPSYDSFSGVLNAQCQNEQGSYVPSTININACASKNCNVFNNKGQLECGYLTY